MPMYRRITELSHELSPEMPTYPGQPPLVTEIIRSNETDGFQVTRIGMNTHHGTHVDAPSHFVSGTNKTVTDYAASDLVGEGIVLWVQVGRSEGVTGEMLQNALTSTNQDMPTRPIVLVRTDFQDNWGHDARVHGTEHPYLTADAARWLLQFDPKVVGIDSTSFERHGVEIPSETPAHNQLLGAGVLLIEELANLHTCDWPRPLVVVAPLPLKGADGAPCRVFAMELA
jgi:kynurenine formamidase